MHTHIHLCIRKGKSRSNAEGFLTVPKHSLAVSASFCSGSKPLQAWVASNSTWSSPHSGEGGLCSSRRLKGSLAFSGFRRLQPSPLAHGSAHHSKLCFHRLVSLIFIYCILFKLITLDSPTSARISLSHVCKVPPCQGSSIFLSFWGFICIPLRDHYWCLDTVWFCLPDTGNVRTTYDFPLVKPH